LSSRNLCAADSPIGAECSSYSFKSFQDVDGRWRRRITGRNGEKVVSSTGSFTYSWEANEERDRVQKAAPYATVRDMTRPAPPVRNSVPTHQGPALDVEGGFLVAGDQLVMSRQPSPPIRLSARPWGHVRGYWYAELGNPTLRPCVAAYAPISGLRSYRHAQYRLAT
jgi:hypothetical protein